MKPLRDGVVSGDGPPRAWITTTAAAGGQAREGARVSHVKQKARNQALAREVNEQIASLSQTRDKTQLFDALCECGEIGCTRRLKLNLDAYEAVRAWPTRFVLVRGHEDGAVEEVVAEREGYVVVENKGPAAETAREADPRA